MDKRDSGQSRELTQRRRNRAQYARNQPKGERAGDCPERQQIGQGRNQGNVLKVDGDQRGGKKHRSHRGADGGDYKADQRIDRLFQLLPHPPGALHQAALHGVGQQEDARHRAKGQLQSDVSHGKGILDQHQQ